MFEFHDVIPGDYLVAALEYVRTEEWADPAFLENLRAGATRVRVDEGTTGGSARPDDEEVADSEHWLCGLGA